MRRSSLTFLGLWVLAACAPAPKAVSVDLDAVLASEPWSRPTIPAIPAPPKPRPGIVVTLPGQKAQTLKDPSVGTLSAAEGVEEAQQKAQKSLSRRLAAFYQRESERFANEERKRLGDPYRKAFDTEYPTIRARFDRYANQRGPLLAKLTFRVGFPDPNPENKPLPKVTSPLLQKRLDEAASLRTEIKRLDADYREDVTNLMAHAEGMARVAMVELEKRISDYMDMMQETARREAAEEIRAHPAELGLRLATPQRLNVPATPDQKVIIPPEEAIPAPPQVQSGGVFGAKSAERKLLLRRQLEIWLAQNRYALVTPGPAVRDATHEFMTWRKERQAGL